MSEAVDQRDDGRTGWYVYGVGPADVAVDADAQGVGDPPAEVFSIRHGDIAALASQIDVSRALGTPQDLMAHAQVLDSAAAEATILPMRFGSVMATADAVADELLAAHHDEFKDSLRKLKGRAQYVVNGRYVEDVVLAGVLQQNERAARLRESIRDKPEEASRPERIELGEIVNEAIAQMREQDTQRVMADIEPLSESVTVREPSHEYDAVHLAVLAEHARESELEETLSNIANEWTGRVQLRLLGPLAPYDFIDGAGG